MSELIGSVGAKAECGIGSKIFGAGTFFLIFLPKKPPTFDASGTRSALGHQKKKVFLCVVLISCGVNGLEEPEFKLQWSQARVVPSGNAGLKPATLWGRVGRIMVVPGTATQDTGGQTSQLFLQVSALSHDSLNLPAKSLKKISRCAAAFCFHICLCIHHHSFI
jgi:hypothetical protein